MLPERQNSAIARGADIGVQGRLGDAHHRADPRGGESLFTIKLNRKGPLVSVERTRTAAKSPAAGKAAAGGAKEVTIDGLGSAEYVLNDVIASWKPVINTRGRRDGSDNAKPKQEAAAAAADTGLAARAKAIFCAC